jgi:ssDNA-binding Zn-finger/Zn-ribbon topoisomerase 1
MSVFNGRTAPTCPNCGHPTKLRTARQGPFIGEEFWGCSRYPDCRGIVKLNGTAVNWSRRELNRPIQVERPNTEATVLTATEQPKIKEQPKPKEEPKKTVVRLLNPEIAESDTEDKTLKRFAALEID